MVPISSKLSDLIAEDLMSQDFIKIDKESTLDKAVTSMKNNDAETLIVFSGKSYAGVLTYRDILRFYSRNIMNTKISQNISRLQPLDSKTNIFQLANFMVRNNSIIVPIGDKNKIIGVVKKSDIIQKVLDSRIFDYLKVSELMTQNPITLTTESNIAQALSQLNENNISHLPIIDSLGAVVGILGNKDISDHMFSLKKHSPSSSKPSPTKTGVMYEDQFYASSDVSDKKVQVSSIMDKDIISIYPDTLLSEVLKDPDCVVLVQENKELLGIVTAKDLIRKLSAYVEKKQILVSISGINSIDLTDFEVTEIYKMIEDTVQKIAKKENIDQFSVYMKSHQVLGMRKKYSFRCRVSTAHESFNAKHDGWEILLAFGKLMDHIERMVIESDSKKRNKTREEHRRYVLYMGDESFMD